MKVDYSIDNLGPRSRAIIYLSAAPAIAAMLAGIAIMLVLLIPAVVVASLLTTAFGRDKEAK